MDPLGTIQLVVDGPVATLWLDRPEKRNALDVESWRAIPRLVASAADTGAHTLVVRGRGGHFCAGADIAEVGLRLADAHDPDGYRAANARAARALADAPMVTVAAIEGSCVGGGVQLAAACDLRLAASTARFGITPAKLGIAFPAPSLVRLVGLVGTGAAKRLLLTGELVGAVEAHRLGLVDIVVGEEAFNEELEALVSTLGSRSLLTQLCAGDMIDELSETGTVSEETVLRWEATAFAAGDLEEGLTAFAEGREARFAWRPRRTTT